MAVKSSWLPLGLSATTLGLGGGIYLALRPPTLLMFDWLDAAGLLEPIQKLRVLAEPWENSLPEWMVYSLPQGLWSFRFLLMIGCVWKHDSGLFRSYAVPLIFGVIGSELLQLGPLQGTFDWFDLTANTLGIISAWGVRNAIYTQQRPSRIRVDRNRRICTSGDGVLG
jgi:hypothetical protein